MKSETHTGALDPIAEVYAELDQLRTQLKSVEAERDEARQVVKGWIKENGPGGWINQLRLRVQEAEWLLEKTKGNMLVFSDRPSLDWFDRRDAFLNPKPQAVK